MTISKALSNATSGLSAAALRASIASNNIANANSPGYVRRDLSVSERAQGGVITNGIVRSQNVALTRDRQIAEASANRADVVANASIELSRALGDPESGYGLFTNWQKFETSLTELSVTPESSALQHAVVLAGKDLAADFNSLNQLANDQRVAADEAIGNAVSTINNALKDLHEINRNLTGADPSSEGTASLEDQRQQLIDEIARLMPVTVTRTDNNQVNILTKEGVVLLSDSVRQLDFSRANNIVSGDAYPGGSLSGLSVDGIDITPGAGARFSIQSGALAGYFDTRDRSAPEFQRQIDALAADLVGRLQDASVDTSLTPGDAGLFTDEGNAFNPANELGLAGRISLNASVDPDRGGSVWRLRDGLNATTQGASGDNGILNNMIDALGERRSSLTGVSLSGSFNMAEAISEVNASVGAARTRAESTLASATARAEILSNAELSATAVNTDQEMQTLLLIEQAYAANARVIQTVNSLMSTLLEI